MKTTKIRNGTQVTKDEMLAIFNRLRLLTYNEPTKGNMFTITKMIDTIRREDGIALNNRNFNRFVAMCYPNFVMKTRQGRHLAGAWFEPKSSKNEEQVSSPEDNIDLEKIVRKLFVRKLSIVGEISARRTMVRRIEQQIRLIRATMTAISPTPER